MAFVETMTPRERTMAALNRQPVDRTPVANPTNVATVELMDLVDAPFSASLPGTGAGGAAGGNGLHRAGIRLDHAVLQHHPGIVGAGLRDAMGGQGQLADRPHVPAHLEDGGRRAYSSGHPGAPRHACHHRLHPPTEGGVRRRGGHHRQDHGAVDAGVPRLRRGAVPAGHG